MNLRDIHPYLPDLVRSLLTGRISRREFLRTSTLLGLSAAAAYGVAGESHIRESRAETPRRGGTLRMALGVGELSDPATINWVSTSNLARQFLEYLTVTGPDNVTYPHLLESWRTSRDLKTWTFKVRGGVRWTNGDLLTVDHVLWNVNRWLDPNTGSSVQGLFKALLEEDSQGNRRPAEGAIERVDNSTFRLNLHTPDIAIPEAFYHYPAAIVHPASEVDGVVDVSRRPIGTGPFLLADYAVGEQARLTRNPNYWGGPSGMRDLPYLEEVILIDLGEDTAAHVSALASKQVELLEELSIQQLDDVDAIAHARTWEVVTAQTAVARMQMDAPEFEDARVRNAVCACIDHDRMLELAYRGKGAPAEDHHVAPIHPEYADIGPARQDYDKAERLLAEAGKSDGLQLTLAVNNSNPWQVSAAQAMEQMLKPANIDLSLDVMPAPSFWDIWDKTDFGLTSWTHRPLGVMVYNLAYVTGAPWNESHHSNPEFDAAVAEANTLLSPEARKKPMMRAERLLRESGVISQTLWRSVFTAGSKRLKGYRQHPTSYFDFRRVWLD